MNNLSKRFAKRFKQIRLVKGLSQGDVARKLKVHRSYVSGIERGVRNPSLRVVERLATGLGVSVKDLFKD